jgi:hypothetical protein
MIALVISFILGASLYFLYNHQHRQYLSEKNMSDLQQNSRFVMDAMGRDLIMAGYRAPDTPGITEAYGGRVSFEYWDDKLPPSPPYDNHVKITFRKDSTDLVHLPVLREVRRYNPSAPAGSRWSAAQPYVVGEYVKTLRFYYYDNQNNLLNPDADPDWVGTDSARLERVRSIKVRVEVRSYDKDPFANPADSIEKQYRWMTLERTFQARNLGITGNPTDVSPPAPPTGVMAIDPGVCGRLDLQWTANSEADLAGYYIFLGQSPGVYLQRYRVAPTATTYTITGLDSTTSTDPAPITYYIAMSAYDRSANNSANSAEIFGNPVPSVSSFADVPARGSDTTLNPRKPLPPTTFEARDGAAEGSVQLTWAPSTSPDVVEYRLHRSTDPAFIPSGTDSGAGNCVAVLDVADPASPPTSFTDTGLIGCVPYYYKLTAVNCDESLVAAYTAADYATCYGDGAGTRIAADVPTVNITDSTPYDNTKIDDIPQPVPEISSFAGWKRVFITLKNPNLTDDPDFDRTEVYYSTSDFPAFLPGTCTIDPASGTRVIDHGGTFTVPGSAAANNFKHDSETVENPPEPELSNSTTFYYLATSFDKCGNCTDAKSSATTLSELCGDDPPGLPQCSPAIHLSADAEGCAGVAYLSWTGECLKDGVIGLNQDFSGFHVFRNEGPIYDPSHPTHQELTGGVPQWYQTFSDASMTEGTVYSYAVKWADCAFEHDNGGNISNPAVNGGLIENVSVGRLDTDSDDVIRTGDLTVSPPTYRHNTVTFYLQNTSGRPMTLGSIQISWGNPTAYLRRIVIGDGSTTAQSQVWEAAPPLTFGSTGGTLTVAKSLDALDEEIPVVLTFQKSDGTVGTESDMRETQLNLTLNYANTSTGSSCGLTIDGQVPAGPVVMQVVQDQPVAPTTAWAVPGYSGTNVKDQVTVPGGPRVAVYARVQDNSGGGIASATVYYYVDAGGTLTEPPAYNGFNYTPLAMTHLGGTYWGLTGVNTIPAADNSSVWYFIVAVDGDGNFDRDPEINGGAYQYFQQQTDICQNWPSAPPSLTGSVAGNTVTLTWTKPTTNTNGTLLTDLAGYKIWRADGWAWTQIATITNPDTLTYADTVADMNSKHYYWTVSAYDSCASWVNEGPWYWPYFEECLGEPPCVITYWINPFDGDWSRTYVLPGDRIQPYVTACGKRDNFLWMQDCAVTDGDADPIRLQGDGWGNYWVDSNYYGGQWEITTYLRMNYPPEADNLDLAVSNTGTDTIKLQAFWNLPSPPSDAACNNDWKCQKQIGVGVPPIPPPHIARDWWNIWVGMPLGGAAPASQTFHVWNDGGLGSTLNYTLTKDSSPWFSISPTSGTSTGEQDPVTVSFNTAGLGVGNYNGTITIADPAAGNSPQTITVNLNIWYDPCTNTPAPPVSTALGWNGPAPSSNGYSAPLGWTAPAGPAWWTNPPDSWYRSKHYYNVQRSEDGVTWQQVNAAIIPAFTPAGVYQTALTFTDTTPMKLKNAVYRWRIESVNGECATNIRRSYSAVFQENLN